MNYNTVKRGYFTLSTVKTLPILFFIDFSSIRRLVYFQIVYNLLVLVCFPNMIDSF